MGAKQVTFSIFIERSMSIHGDKYEYFEDTFINTKINTKIYCRKCQNHFYRTPNSHLKGYNCPQCGIRLKAESKIEKAINNFERKSNIIHNNKYDYSLVAYKNAKIAVIIICPIHGEFNQLPSNHLVGRGCRKCGKDSSTNIIQKQVAYEFESKANKVHNYKYDYSLVNYENNHTKVKIICPIHGVFEQEPGNHLNGNRCSKCQTSKGENEVRKSLEFLNTSFNEQFPLKRKNKRSLKFDFYLPKYDLYIEYQGEQHYKPVRFGGMSEEKAIEKFKIQQVYDQYKRNQCEENNHTLLEIPYWDFNNIEKILRQTLIVH